MQNSSGGKTSPWLIPQFMVACTVGLKLASSVVFHIPKLNSWSLIKHSKRHRICFSNSRECARLVFSWDPWGSRPSALWLTMPGVSHALAVGWFVLSSDHAVEFVSLAFRLESFQSKKETKVYLPCSWAKQNCQQAIGLREHFWWENVKWGISGDQFIISGLSFYR